MALYHWEDTGWQDCDNIIDPSDLLEAAEHFVRAGATEREALAAAVDEELNEGREYWLLANAQDARDDGLAPARAYEAWRRGWRACALQILTKAMDDALLEEEEDHHL